jgi:hypothetical protein
MVSLPNHPINIKELELARKLAAQALGVRYYKLAPRQAMLAMVKHNSQFCKPGNPFTREAA